MEKITVLENEFVSLWFHPDEKIVHHQFHKKTIYSEVFREVLLKGTGLINEHGAHKWLSDDRLHVVLAQQDADWSVNDWFPNTLNSGWKYWAIVQPENLIGKMEIDGFTTAYASRGLIVKYFDESSEAFEWLKNQP